MNEASKLRKAYLGISSFYHDSAVALTSETGEVLFAAHEERYSRVKFDPTFPHNAIRNAVEFANLNNYKIEIIGFYEKTWLKRSRQIYNLITLLKDYKFKNFFKYLKLFISKNEATLLVNNLKRFETLKNLEIKSFEHHYSHAASVFFSSGMEEALIFVFDGVGEWNSSSVWIGKDNKLSKIWSRNFPDSLGLAYSAFTQLCGFKVNSGEYKLMGLAPYGVPRFAEKIFEQVIIRQPEPFFYKLNQEYFSFLSGEGMANLRLLKLFGLTNFISDESELKKIHLDIAASIQFVLERIALDIISHFMKSTGIRKLCLAGGVALNCVMNSKIAKIDNIDDIFLQPACGDAGAALGAALSLSARTNGFQNRKLADSYLGNRYEKNEILKILHDRADLEYVEFDNEQKYLDEITKFLIDGQAGGWFHGRSEYGPRSLGARSIIALPYGSKVQKHLNLKVKFRESFRPFAPAALEEDAMDIFDLKFLSPFMLFTANAKNNSSPGPINSEYIDERIILDHLAKNPNNLASVIHVDNSARIQTVDQHNEIFYRLLKRLKTITGSSICINTSFNVRGEPIVESPSDALNCFLGTDLDFLAIEGIIIRKTKATNLDTSYAHQLMRD